jgi:hypothetical protein
MTDYHEGEVGVAITYATLDTTIGATADFTLQVEKPSGATVEWEILNGELNLTTGLVTHESISGEIDEPGEYKLQGVKNTGGATPDIILYAIKRIRVFKALFD